MIDIFRAGWTERIKYDLAHDGEALVLTGLTIGLRVYDCNGNPVTFAGTVGIANATEGTAYFDPAPTDLKSSESPYSVTWSVTDGAGKVAFFPREEDLKWTVRR